MIHIVTGPPCSGKSTYVREHSKQGDVIVDFDVIAKAFGSGTDYMADGAVRDCAFKARTAAIRYLVRHANECEGWIIHTSPPDWQRREYESVGADFVNLDTDIETCIKRARADGRPEATERIIREWFERKNATNERVELQEERRNLVHGGIIDREALHEHVLRALSERR